MTDTPIKPHDLDTLVLYSVRYAIGRMTFAPTKMSDITRAYWRGMTDSGRANVHRDVREAVAADMVGDRSLGMDCDKRTWALLLAWLDSAEAPHPGCGCFTCIDDPRLGFANRSITRMAVCPDCGNKRCPKASFHGNACTNSNAPGQPGSRDGNHS